MPTAPQARVTPADVVFTLPDLPDGPGDVADLMPTVARDPGALEDEMGIDRGERREIQQRLALAGFSAGGVDGIFGQRTREAISLWQDDRGLPATGYLDAGQLGLLKHQTDGAFRQSSATTPARAVKSPPPRKAPAAPGTQGRTGRYVDKAGCLREPDGSAVPFFKPGC